jgi:GTP-binding protein
VIVHLVDAFPIDGTDPWENYQIIESELAQYSDQLADRARILVLNKMDLQSIGDIDDVRAKFSNVNAPIYEISGATSQGVNELLFAMAAKLDSPQEEAAVIAPVLRRHHDSAWDAVPVEDGFELTGRRLLRLVAMTNLDSADAVHYLHRRLQEIGVIDKLKALGAQDGDTIYIDSHEFEYTDWS